MSDYAGIRWQAGLSYGRGTGTRAALPCSCGRWTICRVAIAPWGN